MLRWLYLRDDPTTGPSLDVLALTVVYVLEPLHAVDLSDQFPLA